MNEIELKQTYQSLSFLSVLLLSQVYYETSFKILQHQHWHFILKRLGILNDPAPCLFNIDLPQNQHVFNIVCFLSL